MSSSFLLQVTQCGGVQCPVLVTDQQSVRAQVPVQLFKVAAITSLNRKYLHTILEVRTVGGFPSADTDQI